MKTRIKAARLWLNTHTTVKQWLWFIALWLGGIASFLTLAYPLKILIKSLG